jgi:hypothetical protein
VVHGFMGAHRTATNGKRLARLSDYHLCNTMAITGLLLGYHRLPSGRFDGSGPNPVVQFTLGPIILWTEGLLYAPLWDMVEAVC